MNEKSDITFINLSEEFQKIWIKRKIVYLSVAIFLLIGIILVIGTPKEYKSEATLLVETNSKSGGMSNLLQQYGALAGINVKEGEYALTPELYPEIIKSLPFLFDILNQKVTESKYDSTLTIAQYLDRYSRQSLSSLILGNTFGLPNKIIGLIRGKSQQKQELTKNKARGMIISERQLSLAGALAGHIKASKGTSPNILIISVESQDPFVSAQVNDSVVKSLQRYIIDYRTQKTKTELKFVLDRYSEAKAKYLQTQQELADYRDKNKNVIIASSRTLEERLQSEFNIAFTVFNSLSQQLEQTQMKVQESTPVFKILNPAIVPISKSKPNTGIIIGMMIFLGVITGIIIIYYKNRS